MDPDNELYDAACELLQAAQRVDDASHGEGLDGVVRKAAGHHDPATELITAEVARA